MNTHDPGIYQGLKMARLCRQGDYFWLQSGTEKIPLDLCWQVSGCFGFDAEGVEVVPRAQEYSATGQAITIEGDMLLIGYLAPMINTRPIIIGCVRKSILANKLRAQNANALTFTKRALAQDGTLNGTVVATVNGDADDMARLAVSATSGLTLTTGKDGQATIEMDDDGNIKLNGGGKQAARKEDATIVNSSTDSAMVSFMAKVAANFATLIAAVGAVLPPLQPIVAPSSITGKIDEGSDTVEIGD